MNCVSDCSENPFFEARKKRLKRKARPAAFCGARPNLLPYQDFLKRNN